MKKFILLAALCGGVMVANAQISTGESTSKVIRTGNRAQAGNFGIYIGATSDMFKKIGDDSEFSALPLINVKYMFTDKLEGRIGLEWWKDKTINKYTEEGEEGEGSETFKSHNSEKSYMFYPGVAYHFNNRNLLDVYVGGELPIGFANYGYGDDDDEYYTSQFRIGLGGFIGLQAYIANLPLAVGLEYGIHGLWNMASNGSLTEDGMSIAAGSYNEDYSQKRFKLGHQVRFTLTYYFNL